MIGNWPMYLSLKTEKLVQYYIVSLLIIFSGSIIPFIFSESYSAFIVFFIANVLCVLPICRTAKIVPSGLAYFLLIISCLLLMLLFRGDFESIKVYFGFIARFLSAYLVVTLVSKERFIKILTDIVVAYSAFSLVMYSLGLIFPTLILHLPVSYNDAGTGYRHLYLYFYQGIDSWNYRNAGVFWEAGAYQVFLSLALLLEVYVVRGSLIRRLFLAAAIASTLSTVGALVLVLLSSALFRFRRRLLSYVLPVGIVAIVLMSNIFNNLVLEKFNAQDASGAERLTGQLADLQVFLNNPIFGAGVSEYTASFNSAAYALGATIPTSTNSFTGMLALNGILYSVILFAPIFLFFLRMPVKIRERLLMLTIFVLLLSSQGMLNQILFLCLAFYGLQRDAARNWQLMQSPPSRAILQESAYVR